MYFGPKLGQGRHAGFRIRHGAMLVFSLRTVRPHPLWRPLSSTTVIMPDKRTIQTLINSMLHLLSLVVTDLSCVFICCSLLLMLFVFFSRVTSAFDSTSFWLGYLCIASWRVEQRIDLERTSPLF